MTLTDRVSLRGKVALVTGASRGIGRATALRLAESGADVVVNYLSSRDAAMEVAEEIRDLGRRVVVARGDVTEPEDHQALADMVQSEFGRLDVLVSNVASGGFRNLMDASLTNFESALRTNAWALLGLVQALRPQLEAAEGRARVIALSSHGSHRALQHYGVIGASKAALESLVRHLALELGDSMNVNVVLAGLVRTRATAAVPDEAFDLASRAMMMEEGRELSPGDVADTVLYLASPLSTLVQGQTIVVDGGAGVRG